MDEVARKLILGGHAKLVDATVLGMLDLLVDVTVVLLTEGDVLIILRRGRLQDAVQERPGREAVEESEGSPSVDIVVLLGGHEGLTTDAVRVPSRGNSDGLLRGVLNRVPPPRGVEEHVTGLQLGRIDGAVLEQGEGLEVVVRGPEDEEDGGGLAEQSHGVGQEGVIGVDEEPLLGALDHVEHVVDRCVVEGGAGALSADEDLLVAGLHLQVGLQALVLEQVADLGVLVEEHLGVVQVHVGVVHVFELAGESVHLPLGEEDVLLAVLLHDGVPGQVVQQLGVLHEAAEDHRVGPLDEGLAELRGVAVLPVVLRDGHLAGLGLVARGDALRDDAVGQPLVEHVQQRKDTDLGEEEVKDADLTGEGGAGPDEDKPDTGDEVVLGTGLRAPRRGVLSQVMEQRLHAEPALEQVADADADLHQDGDGPVAAVGLATGL
mmetsp:Transcript_67090/g.144733  ORF Transcript_67090/g.144733 Transcript_67090/m.144733 type:complete len:434 (-) Transcript_67090:95-1396(-)